MKQMQQRFWPDAQPLMERLGGDFFRELPETPGVYRMEDESQNVLYIGKAKNLRRRVGSYRVANPERMPRRTLRLLKLVRRIVWEGCADEAAALRREAELLLAIKPRFNRAGVWRGPRRYLVWRGVASGLELAVTESVESGWLAAGSFGAQGRHLHRALVRLLWCAFHRESGLAGMPAGWFRGAYGHDVILSLPDAGAVSAAEQGISALARGGIEEFKTWIGPAPFAFEQPLFDEDMELVTKSLPGRLVCREGNETVAVVQTAG